VLILHVFFENVKIPTEIKVLPVEAELYVFSFGDGGDGVSDGDVTHELLHKDSVSPPHRLRVCCGGRGYVLTRPRPFH
jgi:hypothetical protein